MLNRIVSIEQKYLKPFNCVQKLNCWYYVAIRKTILHSANKWSRLKILSTNYTFTNHIYLKYKYICVNGYWDRITNNGWYAIKANPSTNQPIKTVEGNELMFFECCKPQGGFVEPTIKKKEQKKKIKIKTKTNKNNNNKNSNERKGKCEWKFEAFRDSFKFGLQANAFIICSQDAILLASQLTNFFL